MSVFRHSHEQGELVNSVVYYSFRPAVLPNVPTFLEWLLNKKIYRVEVYDVLYSESSVLQRDKTIFKEFYNDSR